MRATTRTTFTDDESDILRWVATGPLHEGVEVDVLFDGLTDLGTPRPDRATRWRASIADLVDRGVLHQPSEHRVCFTDPVGINAWIHATARIRGYRPMAVADRWRELIGA